MKYLHLFTIVVSCLVISSQASAKVYKWTDEKGQVHYSEHPSSTQSNQVIKPKTGHSDPVNYATASSAAASAGSKTLVAEVPEPKDPEACATARKNQSILQTSVRVQVVDDNGQYRYLEPNELKEKMDEANRVIEEQCE